MLCPASEPLNPQADQENLLTYGPRDGFCPGNCFLNSICCHKVMFVSSNRLWNFPPDSHLPCSFWVILHRTIESMARSKLRFNDSGSISFNFARAINNNIKESGYLSHLLNPVCGIWKETCPESREIWLWLWNTLGYPCVLNPQFIFFFYAMVPSLILPLKNNPREYRPAFWHPCVKWKQSLYITCTSERVYTCKFQRKSPKNRCSVLLFIVWLCVERYRNANIWHMTFGECSFLLTIIFLILIQVVYINSYLFLLLSNILLHRYTILLHHMVLESQFDLCSEGNY